MVGEGVGDATPPLLFLNIQNYRRKKMNETFCSLWLEPANPCHLKHEECFFIFLITLYLSLSTLLPDTAMRYVAINNYRRSLVVETLRSQNAFFSPYWPLWEIEGIILEIELKDA